jgi:tol-pal system protein YbgF
MVKGARMKVSAIGLLTAGVLMVASPAVAADKTHQQMMAEIRMLQEQNAQIMQTLGGLADTLKTMTAKIDETTGATRKGFADQGLVINGIADNMRVLREKSDDTNVRLATMTQEIESLRQAIQSMPVPVAPQPVAPGDPDAPPPPVTLPANPAQGVSPGKAWDAAWNDYTSGQYDLAIQGFEFFLKTFPNSPQAGQAQLNIGNSFYLQGKYKEAITAFQRVVSGYAGSPAVPQAYFKLGQSYEALKQPDLARKAYETVIKDHPGSPDATLAKQRLDSINKK